MEGVSPGFTTKGIVINAGAEFENNPYYDELVQVRVPELHGLGPIAKFKTTEEQFTKDEDLPWARFIPNNIVEYESLLECKANTVAEGDEVFVQFPTGKVNDILVLGVYAKYTEELYQGIDVSSIVSNAKKWTVVTVPKIDEDENHPDYSVSDSGSGQGASNQYVEKYKEYFGYPFSSRQTVSCPFGKKGGWAAGKHTGIDLSGAVGTPIYAVGDGTVVESVSNHPSYGNYVIISHGTVLGKKLWTLYAHMDKSPSVKKGDIVKGTQNGQSGTKLGVRGSTGNSTGPHLHFEFRVGSNNYSSYTNPNEFIKF